MFFFVGLNIALYGLALMIMGTWLLDKTAHGASGSAMWFGIIVSCHLSLKLSYFSLKFKTKNTC